MPSHDPPGQKPKKGSAVSTFLKPSKKESPAPSQNPPSVAPISQASSIVKPADQKTKQQHQEATTTAVSKPSPSPSHVDNSAKHMNDKQTGTGSEKLTADKRDKEHATKSGQKPQAPEGHATSKQSPHDNAKTSSHPKEHQAEDKQAGNHPKEAAPRIGSKKMDEKPKFSEIEQLNTSNNFKDIMRRYSLSWNKAKEHLTQDKFAKKENGESDTVEYGRRLHVMKGLVQYRNDQTKQVLESTLLAEAQVMRKNKEIPNSDVKVVPLTNGLRARQAKPVIEAIYPGSSGLTSDIDITFKVPGHEEHEVDLVKKFNSGFKASWFGHEPGYVFDVNAYTQGFMSKPAGHLPGTGYEKQLGEEHHAQVIQAINRTQMALGFLSIRRYFGNRDGKDTKQWDSFRQKAQDSLKEWLNRAFGKDKAHATAAVSLAQTELGAILGKTDLLYSETQAEFEKTEKAVDANARGNRDRKEVRSHIKAVASSKLYENQLDRVKGLLKERREILKGIDKDETAPAQSDQAMNDLETQRQRLADNLKSFEIEQGKALVYANEAYYTSGSAIHVVKGLQGAGDIKLGHYEQMSSLLMNIGYKLEHYRHHLEETGDQGEALVQSAKYGERVRDIVKQGTPELQAERSQELEAKRRKDVSRRKLEKDKRRAGRNLDRDVNPKLYAVLGQDIATLDLEKKLITEYKNNDSMTPSEKQQNAKKDLGPRMNKEKFDESYLRIAVKILGPYYEDMFRKKSGI